MPAKNFIVTNKARKDSRKIPQGIKKRLASVLLYIKEHPLAGTKLHGDLVGLYKYRIGDYRIIYSFDSRKSIIFILKIEHRQGVYK